MITSCTPKPLTTRRGRWKVRVGCASRESAANLLGITRACHGTSVEVGTRSTSGGVSFSFPGQKGQVATNDGTGFRSRWRTISSGRRARSVAIITHSLVAKFCRSSDIVPPRQSVHQRLRVEQSPRVVFLRLAERAGGGSGFVGGDPSSGDHRPRIICPRIRGGIPSRNLAGIKLKLIWLSKYGEQTSYRNPRCHGHRRAKIYPNARTSPVV